MAAGYHELTLDTAMASASAIRHAVAGFGRETLPLEAAAQLPKESPVLLAQALQRNETLSWNDFSPQLFYRLLTDSQEELAAMQDVGEELAVRICRNRLTFTSAESFADRIKTR